MLSPHSADRPGHPRGQGSRVPAWLVRVGQLGRHRSPAARRRGPLWRLLTPLGFVAAGTLMVTSAVNSQGTDLRPGQYSDLADLARQETRRVQELRDEAAALQAEIDQLSAQVDHGGVRRLERQVEQLAGPAGLTALAGPGLTVTLSDAPEGVRDTAGDQIGEAIVHQQDIQAVANALWAGGAEAMTLQGQRVVSTTGIKCVGNTVLLHGVTYSPPYVISAVGDVASMRAALAASPYVQAYLDAVDQWRLGWDVAVEDRVEMPAYEGPAEMRYARAAGAPSDDT